MITFYSERHWQHAPALEFFEGELTHYHDTPQRAQIILDAIQRCGVGLVQAPQDFGPEPILAVHDADYVQYLQTAYQNWVQAGGLPAGVYPDTFPVRGMSHRPTRPSALAGYYSMDLTAVIVPGTWQAAYQSAQCALSAAQAVRAGAGSAFALCRPPGHHAHADLCGGYCFLNNAAIAAHWLTQSHGARVALLDIDFHHGNGTQDIFYARDDVFYISLHGDPDRQYPYFTGAADQCGAGAGRGYTLNYPLDANVDDDNYLQVLGQACEHIGHYAPSMLMVSLGVDTYAEDPLGDFKLTPAAYSRIGAALAQLRVPTVFIMEGGYAIEQLGQNVVGVLMGFESA
jgi:acetoin utilization deacetylase AcuC-like enzyme